MKNASHYLKLAASGLCLTAVLYNCKPNEVASLTPFEYTFKGLDDVKLPDVQPTTPAAVSVTAATVTLSAQAAAVSSGLQAIATSGKVPEVVQQAASDVGKVISQDKATSLEAGFTDEVVKTLTEKGTLPTALKSDVWTITGNPTMKAYLPTFSLPQVNGKTVGARTGATPDITIPAIAAFSTLKDEDKCKKAANDAFKKAVDGLDATRKAQTATIEAAYRPYEAAANSDYISCQSGIPAKYKTLIDNAKKDLDNNLANLKAGKKVMGESMYKTLTAMAYVTYSQVIEVYNNLMAAEMKACDLAKEAKLTAARAARDKDLSTINTNYNAVLHSAEASRDKAVASCHNQGNGG